MLCFFQVATYSNAVKIWFMYRNTTLYKTVSDLMKWIIWKSCFLKLYVSCYFGVVSLSEKVKVAQSCPTLCSQLLFHWAIPPCPTLWDRMDYTVRGILQAQNTGVGSLSLLQGIFPTQGSNPGLLHCRWILHSWATGKQLNCEYKGNY